MKNKIDLLVSFDTTGSMYPVLAQVRREVEQFVKTMFTEFTDLRLGIIAHGDYCDKDNPYTIRMMDFTRDEVKLCKFVRETEKTFGGDADECYELVLNTAHKCLDWRDDADKIMIMIGDASPHGVYYRDNKEGLDWEKEAGILAKEGIKIFAVHALASYRSSSRAFYKRIAEKTLGVYLTLDMFNEIVDLIKATCYQQGGEERLNEFVTIIRDSGKMTHSMENNIKRLRGEEVEEPSYYDRVAKCDRKVRTRMVSSDDTVTLKEMGKLVPVIPGRFQIMAVDEDCAIKEFVESNGITFKKGRGFYELSKAETVQQYKEVIMMDRETGEMFNGSQVREELGLQPQSEKGGVNERLHKDATKKFRVFVQSTSVNRKLIAGTTFLYEVDDLEDTGTVVEVAAKDEKVTKKVNKKATETIEAVKEDKVKVTKKASKKVEETSKKEVKKVEVEKKTTEKPVKTTKRTSKKVEEAVEFSDLDTSAIEVADVDSTKKKIKASTDKVKKSETNKEDLDTKALNKKLKNINDTIEKINKQIDVVKEASSRYNKSQNKKNTTYMCNNLKKLRDLANKLDKLM